jgi:hypothetical protein
MHSGQPLSPGYSAPAKKTPAAPDSDYFDRTPFFLSFLYAL